MSIRANRSGTNDATRVRFCSTRISTALRGEITSWPNPLRGASLRRERPCARSSPGTSGVITRSRNTCSAITAA